MSSLVARLSSATRALPAPAAAAAPPPSSADPDAAWLTRSVRFVGRAIVVGAALVGARAPLLGLPVEPLPSAVLLGGLLAAGAALWVNRNGRPRLAAQVLAFTLPILSGGLALGTGRGFRDPAVLMLMDVTLILVATSLGVGIVAGRLRRSLERLRQQEAALRASELRYRSLVELAADAILVSTPEEGIVEANRRASELTGLPREAILARPIESLFAPAEVRSTPWRPEALARGETDVAERTLVRGDGRAVPVEMSSKQMPDGTHQSILRDVSERHHAEAERRSLESRLRQAQKMEAVGRLAGGIAHDFNNLLTAITGSLTLALRDIPPPSPARRWLAEVDKSAWRAAALTRHLLAFSRRQVIEPRVVDLQTIVEGMGALVGRTIGEDVKLRVLVPGEPCRVEVDHGQMEQVILNLVTNARDAMPDGGLLTIEVGGAEPSRLPPAPRAQADGRRVVLLSVSDTGHGMDEDVRAQIFQPFFTTKPAGSGTGLGLAIVYGAVEQNGGWLDVETAPGRRATFRIHLPEARPEAAVTALPAPEEVLRGTETVLLVEDEQAVRRVTAGQLESLGYRVLACASGQEALAVASGHEGPLHLLRTDVVMPGMDGRQLATRLGEARPGLRVLYTSGYGEDVIARRGVVEKGVLLLEKPYSLLTLARQLRRALAA